MRICRIPPLVMPMQAAYHAPSTAWELVLREAKEWGTERFSGVFPSDFAFVPPGRI